MSTLLADRSVSDRRLERLVSAPNEAARDAEIARLIESLAPVIDGILARAGRTDRAVTENAADLRADVITRVLGKLHSVASGGDAIDDLADYVATLTRNRLYDFVRTRFPARARLKNRIRFHLANDPRFATWSLDGVTACGLARWSGDTRIREAILPRERVPRTVFGADRAADSLAALFKVIGGPVYLDALVALLMDIWSIAEETAVGLDEVLVPDQRPTQFERVESEAFFAGLWGEIEALRPLQRAALLLNLRGPQHANALVLFVILGIADHDRLAAATGMTAEELAQTWSRLPLDDIAIAERLGISRQQVINLRKSARERLRRRLQT